VDLRAATTGKQRPGGVSRRGDKSPFLTDLPSVPIAFRVAMLNFFL
jgi:hypothetical protein